MSYTTEDNARGAKYSNAASTGAHESGKITITEGLETAAWLANGLNILLAVSILEIGHLTKEEAEDVQYAAHFIQELNQQLLALATVAE